MTNRKLAKGVDAPAGEARYATQVAHIPRGYPQASRAGASGKLRAVSACNLPCLAHVHPEAGVELVVSAAQGFCSW